MKKKKLLIGIPVLILLVLAVILLFPKQKDGPQNEVVLKLNTLLECSEKHSHQSLVWGMSPKEVSEIISIQKDDYRVPQSGTYVAYNSKSECIMAGRHSEVSFEFTDDKLNLVQFYFHVDDTVDEWFVEQVASLREVFGEEMDSVDNSSDLFSSVAYRWDFDDTSLQFAKMTTNKSGKITIVLSVGKIN